MALTSRSDRRLPAGVLCAIAICLGASGTVVLVLFGTVVGGLPGPSSAPWWFHLSTSHRTGIVGFYLGLGLLGLGWAGLGALARRGALTLGACWAALGAWSTPLILGPPLFSRDLYSYVAQGLVAERGLNPYTTSPSVLHANALILGIASVWRHTPAPYGPLSVLATVASVHVAGGSLFAEIIVVRLPEAIGVALMALAVPKIARRLGADPVLGLWLAALSPLTLISLLASGHNEGLMLGVVMLGVLAMLEERLIVGTALGAAAAAVKLPAALAIAFPTMSRLRTATTGRARLVSLVVVVTAVVWVVLTALTGFGFGWLSTAAIKIPADVRTLDTPSVALGVFVASIAHVLGISVETRSVVAVCRTAVSIGTAAALAWLLWNVHRFEWVRILGVALLVLAVGGPTLWPWYFTWGVCVLAATTAQRSISLALLASLPVLLVDAQGTPALTGRSYLVVVPALIAGVAWLSTKSRWRATLGPSHG